MMEINSCCGRWTLRTGSIVIGILDLVIFEFDFCIQLLRAKSFKFSRSTWLH